MDSLKRVMLWLVSGVLLALITKSSRSIDYLRSIIFWNSFLLRKPRHKAWVMVMSEASLSSLISSSRPKRPALKNTFGKQEFMHILIFFSVKVQLTGSFFCFFLQILFNFKAFCHLNLNAILRNKLKGKFAQRKKKSVSDDHLISSYSALPSKCF